MRKCLIYYFCKRTGNTRNSFLPREIGNVDEGVVEGCKDMSNAENKFSISDLWTKLNGGLFFWSFGFFGWLTTFQNRIEYDIASEAASRDPSLKAVFSRPKDTQVPPTIVFKMHYSPFCSKTRLKGWRTTKTMKRTYRKYSVRNIQNTCKAAFGFCRTPSFQRHIDHHEYTALAEANMTELPSLCGPIFS